MSRFSETDAAWHAAELKLITGHVRRDLLERRGASWPAWMELCARMFARKPNPADKATQRALKGHFSIGGANTELAHKQLRERAQRVAELAEGANHVPNQPAPCTFDEQLLFDAFAQRGAWTSGQGGAPSLIRRLREAPALVLPVLLVTESTASTSATEAPGIVANLTMRRLDMQPDEAMGKTFFAAAPASYLLELDPDFSDSLGLVAQLVNDRLSQSAAGSGCRLVWDLEPRFAGERFLHVGGASAGAAFALAALGLLRENFPPNDPLRSHLSDIDWPRAAITARLVDVTGKLGKVSGLGPKLAGLMRQGSLGLLHVPGVFVAADQFDAQQYAPTSHACRDIETLAASVADETAIAKRYGVFPDVVAELHGEGTQYADFIGREWLDELVSNKVIELWQRPLQGGLLVLECPLGFGKTTWALRQVARAQSRRGASTNGEIWNGILDGWAFASKLFGVGRTDATLTGDPETVIAQLDACTRYRLGMKYDGPNDPLRRQLKEGRLHTLLAKCKGVASNRGRPVVLLLDGVDEAFDDIGTLLPRSWPQGVILILIGRPSALHGTHLRATEDRPVIRIRLGGDDDPFAGNVRDDIAQYVAFRRPHIEAEHRVTMLPALCDAIVGASAPLMFVAAGLLRQRSQLKDDLEAWRDGRQSIPRGPRDYLRWSLDRIEGAIVERGKPRDAALAVLAWLAISRENWTAAQLQEELFDRFVTLAEADGRTGPAAMAWHALPECLGDARAVQAVLEHCQDFLSAGNTQDSKPDVLRFAHASIPELMLEFAAERDWTGPLHAAWGVLCESKFADPSSSFSNSSRLVPYALRHGPWHLAKAGHWNARYWKLAADRLLDIRAVPCEFGDAGRQHGYLERLFEGPYESVRKEAWGLLCEAIAAVLEVATGDDSEAAEKLTQLRSLRHVLVDQYEHIVQGHTPLVAALYNRMAGRWKAGTQWGDRLQRAAIALQRPWLMSLEPRPALAHGPLTRYFDDESVTCITASQNSAYVAVGLGNGETWVWTARNWIEGLKGSLATRHASRVSCVALLAYAEHGNWVLASGSDDGTVRVVYADEVESEGWADGEVEAGRVATCYRNRFSHSQVTSVALVADAKRGGWVLASGSIDRTARVVCSDEFESEGWAEGETDAGRIATRHAFVVWSVALLANASYGGWVLASGSTDGTARVVCADEFESEGWAEGEAEAGRVATRQAQAVKCVALLADEKHGGWVLASGSLDGTARVVYADEFEGEGWAEDGAEAGRVAIRHAGRSNGVTSVALLAAAKRGGWVLASGSEDGTARVVYADEVEGEGWADGKAEIRRVATRHGRALYDGVTSVTLLANATRSGWILASGSKDGTARVVYSDDVESAGWAENVGSAGRVAICHKGWNHLSGVVLLADERHGGWVLASGSDDGTARVVCADEVEGEGWAEVEPGRVATRHTGSVVGAALLADEKRGGWVLATGSRDGTARVVCADDVKREDWAKSDGEIGQVAIRHGHKILDQVTSVALLADATRGWVLATGSYDGTARVVYADEVEREDWAKSKAEIGQVAIRHGHKILDQVTSVALLADATRGGWVLATGSYDGTARVVYADEVERAGWAEGEAEAGRVATRHAQGGQANGVSVALLADPTRGGWVLATGWDDGTARVVSADEVESEGWTGAESVNRHSHGGVNSAALLADATRSGWVLATGWGDGTARLVCADEVESEGWAGGESGAGRVATRHAREVNSVALLPDATRSSWVLGSIAHRIIHLCGGGGAHLPCPGLVLVAPLEVLCLCWQPHDAQLTVAYVDRHTVRVDEFELRNPDALFEPLTPVHRAKHERR